MTPVLTIAIPTYNRPQYLRAAVAAVLPQLTPACRLRILDNCSDAPAADLLADQLAAHPGADAAVVRHRANIGGNANVLRCLELCETPWVWVLGDDDVVLPGGVGAALDEIGRAPAARCINFGTNLFARPAGFTSRGAVGFVERLDAFNNALFISANLYRVGPLLPKLHFGHQFAFAMCPHLVTLLTSLGPDGEVVFSDRVVVRANPAVAVEHHWSHVLMAMAVMTIQDLDLDGFDRRVRELLADKIHRWCPSLPLLVMILVAQVHGGRTSRYRAAYLVDQICGRYMWFHRGRVKYRVTTAAARWLVRFPGLTWALFRAYAGLRGDSGSAPMIRALAGISMFQRAE